MTTPSSSRLLYATSFALSLSVRGVSAQSSNTCTTDEFTSLNNKDGDTPCTVAQNLAAPCGGTLNTTQAGDNCSCNTVMYNLLSACALCNASPSASSEVLPDYPTWAAGCPGAVWDDYPDHGVADSAHVPRWAYDSPTKSGRFDLAQAVKSSESRHWTTVQILTPVIVALVFITSLGAAWIYHRRRRRRRRPAHQHSGSTGDEAAHDSLLETKGRRGSEVSLASGGSRLSAKSARGIGARARRAMRRMFRPGVVSVKSQAAPTAFTIDGERAGDASHELDDLVSEEAKRPSAAPSPAPDGTPDLGGFGTGTGTGSGTARTRAKAAMLLAYVMSALGGSRGADYASVAEDGDDDVMNISASKRSVILVAREGHEDFSSQWTPTTSGSRGTSMVSPTRLSRAPSTMLSSPLSTRATHGSALTGSSGSRRSGPGMKPGSLASASMRTASGSASHNGHEQGRKWESRRETGSTDNRRASLEVVPPTPMSRRENPFTAYSPPTPKDSPTKRNAKPYRPPLPPLPSDSNLHSTYMTAASSVPTSPPVQSPPLLPSEAIVSNPPRYASPAHSRTSSYDSTASFSTAYPSPVASPRPLPQPLGLPPAAVPLPPSQTHSRTSSHTTLALAPLPPVPFLSPRATTPQPPSSTSSSSGGTLPSLSAFPAPPTALPQRTFRPSDPQNLIPAAVRGAGYNPYNGSPYGFAGPEE